MGDPFAVMVKQLTQAEQQKQPEPPAKPKAKWVSRYKDPNYMRDYMRKRRYRGMFDTPYTG